LKSKVGDLDDSLNKQDIQIEVLEELGEEYKLNYNSRKILQKFKQNIDNCHSEKKEEGIEFPEVIIEEIWLKTIPELETIENAKKFAYDFYDKGGKRELYEGAIELLLSLRDYHNIKLGIISNAQFYTERDMNRLLDFDLYDIFDKDLCFFSHEEVCSKPNPRSFLKLIGTLEKQSISKDEAIFVGNHAVKDILTSQKCGIKACLFKSEEVVFKEGITPDYEVDSLMEILNIIN
jgi:FMN phosphatase YigB (HAD superfamily)